MGTRAVKFYDNRDYISFETTHPGMKQLHTILDYME